MDKTELGLSSRSNFEVTHGNSPLWLLSHWQGILFPLGDVITKPKQCGGVERTFGVVVPPQQKQSGFAEIS